MCGAAWAVSPSPGLRNAICLISARIRINNNQDDDTTPDIWSDVYFWLLQHRVVRQRDFIQQTVMKRSRTPTGYPPILNDKQQGWYHDRGGPPWLTNNASNITNSMLTDNSESEFDPHLHGISRVMLVSCLTLQLPDWKDSILIFWMTLWTGWMVSAPTAAWSLVIRPPDDRVTMEAPPQWPD